MSEYKQHILLCEDDINLASVTMEYLRSEGFAVDHATNGVEGQEFIRQQSYDLCLLDTVMPQKDGITLLKELRESGKTLPVIMVLDHDEKEDIIQAYQVGADDYVVKPFSMDILICKIRAILRRIQVAEDSQETIFQVGNVTFDSVRQLLGGKRLSTRENDLLLMLCRKSNHLVERSHILKSLWQVDNYFSSRSLAVYINHLRHSMSHVKGARIIAVHGKGYKLVLDPEK
ncbi:MAG: response regulator transcription factor [Paludibacteraceae bacterium]|nr:response regulator transcription factor [Paludibacteraceae bacterium]